MAAITPTNGRVAFLASHDPHTYWVLDSTDLGTNYGDDGSAGGGDNSTVIADRIDTALGYEGMKNQNDPPNNGWLDIYTVTDAAALVYLPSGLTTGDVYGLWHNGGGTNAQSAFLRVTATGVEVAIVHNTGGTNQDNMVHEIPTADLDGWHCIGWQFSSEGGAQGDMGLWVNGTKVADGTRAYQLAYGSGDPDFGASGGDEPTSAGGISPYGADANWANGSAITGSGILIANFAADNPNQTNSSPAGNGDSFHEDYYTAHVVTGPTISDVETTDTFDDGDTAVTITGTTFEASQGTGTVELASGSDYGAATKVAQTVTSWADTAIDFTASLGALTPGTLYLFVTNDSGDRSAGHEVFVRRALAFELSPSANIATGAADATTARLTAPSGKTTGDFDPGKRSDDTSPITGLSIDASGYTEIEWAIEATADAVDGETYEFRVVLDDGTELGAYTVTPTWTVGASTTNLTATATAELTTAATATRSVALTASAAAEATTTATVERSTNLEATAAAELTTTAAASTTTRLTATAAAELTTTTTASRTAAITAQASAELTTQAAAARSIALAAAAAAELTTASEVARTAAIEATGTAELTTTAAASRSTGLTAAAAAELTTTTAAARTVALAALVEAEATTSAQATRSIRLEATAGAELTTTTRATTGSGLTAIASAELTTAAEAGRTATIAASAAAELTTTATATTGSALTATASAELTTAAEASRSLTLTAAAAAELTTAASATTGSGLTATATAELTTQAIAARAVALTALATAEATTQADAGRTVSVTAQAAAELTTQATATSGTGLTATATAELTSGAAATRSAALSASASGELTTAGGAIRLIGLAAIASAELTSSLFVGSSGIAVGSPVFTDSSGAKVSLADSSTPRAVFASSDRETVVFA